jgi:hypothetical protein
VVLFFDLEGALSFQINEIEKELTKPIRVDKYGKCNGLFT